MQGSHCSSGSVSVPALQCLAAQLCKTGPGSLTETKHRAWWTEKGPFVVGLGQELQDRGCPVLGVQHFLSDSTAALPGPFLAPWEIQEPQGFSLLVSRTPGKGWEVDNRGMDEHLYVDRDREDSWPGPGFLSKSPFPHIVEIPPLCSLPLCLSFLLILSFIHASPVLLSGCVCTGEEMLSTCRGLLCTLRGCSHFSASMYQPGVSSRSFASAPGPVPSGGHFAKSLRGPFA